MRSKAGPEQRRSESSKGRAPGMLERAQAHGHTAAQQALLAGALGSWSERQGIQARCAAKCSTRGVPPACGAVWLPCRWGRAGGGAARCAPPLRGQEAHWGRDVVQLRTALKDGEVIGMGKCSISPGRCLCRSTSAALYCCRLRSRGSSVPSCSLALAFHTRTFMSSEPAGKHALACII